VPQYFLCCQESCKAPVRAHLVFLRTQEYIFQSLRVSAPLGTPSFLSLWVLSFQVIGLTTTPRNAFRPKKRSSTFKTWTYTRFQQLLRRLRRGRSNGIRQLCLGDKHFTTEEIGHVYQRLRKFPLFHNGHQKRRFSFTFSDGAGVTNPTMSTTYAQLVHAHLARLQSDTTSTLGQQIARNHMTALRGFLRSLGKTETSPIGDEMASEHTPSVKRYLAQLDVGERSKSDRRSLLNAWRMTFDLMGAVPEVCVRGRERSRADVPSHAPTPFELGLRAALRQAGLAPKQAARLAGVSTSAVGRWTRGALPNLRSDTTLAKLESVLQLPAGRLNELLRETLDKGAPLHRNDYRERLKARCGDVYLLKASDLGDRFLTDWNSLLKHKTAIRTTSKKRYTGGRWSVTGSATSKGALPGISTLNERHFASASIYWNHVSAYLGFLQRPIEGDGWGVDKEAAQSLAWLVVPEALDAYLTFQTERSGGLRHKGHVVFCNTVASFTHPEHGYLLQSPELLEQLPEEATAGRTWSELCGLARRTVAEWKSACSDVSRDPVQPIQFLLDQENPMAPLFEAMRRLRDIGNAAPTGSLEEAVARRDELLLGLLLSNPLRRKNLIELTVRPDNSGTVYLSNAKEWYTRIPCIRRQGRALVERTAHRLRAALPPAPRRVRWT